MNLKDRIREIVKKHLDEMSATGTGSSFNSGPNGENSSTPVAGVAPNYYVKKLGFKLVNKKKLNKAAKGIEVKQLFEEDTPSFDIESYLSSLQTDDETKKYIADKVGDFNTLAAKLKELIELIRNSKLKTINSYRYNQEMKSLYVKDLAITLLDDVIELFKD